jgi:arsenite-transporting ATPase
MKKGTTLDEDKILGELQYIRERIGEASKILTDRQRTAFFFVLVAEEMILLDTKKAATMFAQFDVPVAGYVVNRVLPRDLGEGDGVPPYLLKRLDMQRKYLDQIHGTFGADILAQVPELERDVTGLEMIEKVARLMYDRS